MFERKENINNAAQPFFLLANNKVSQFKANKFKNEHSILNIHNVPVPTDNYFK